MRTGSLIIGKSRHPSFEVFRVLRVTRNGWITCQHHSDQSGKLVQNGFITKFRNSDMVLFNGGNS